MMTRKDYVATAEILKAFADDVELDIDFLVEKFSAMFLNDNPRFNTRIFYGAVFGEDS
jgi:hypothetical protein